jgi:hypothetical protein
VDQIYINKDQMQPAPTAKTTPFLVKPEEAPFDEFSDGVLAGDPSVALPGGRATEGPDVGAIGAGGDPVGVIVGAPAGTGAAVVEGAGTGVETGGEFVGAGTGAVVGVAIIGEGAADGDLDGGETVGAAPGA